MKFARYTFLIAAICDILVLPPLYFQIEKIGRDDPPITHPEFYYGFIGVALFWQLTFLIIPYDPVKYRAMMITGILEKLAFVIPAVLLFFGGNLSTLLFGAAMIDFAHIILFVVAYFQNARRINFLCASTDQRKRMLELLSISSSRRAVREGY